MPEVSGIEKFFGNQIIFLTVEIIENDCHARLQCILCAKLQATSLLLFSSMFLENFDFVDSKLDVR